MSNGAALLRYCVYTLRLRDRKVQPGVKVKGTCELAFILIANFHSSPISQSLPHMQRGLEGVNHYNLQRQLRLDIPSSSPVPVVRSCLGIGMDTTHISTNLPNNRGAAKREREMSWAIQATGRESMVVIWNHQSSIGS